MSITPKNAIVFGTLINAYTFKRVLDPFQTTTWAAANVKNAFLRKVSIGETEMLCERWFVLVVLKATLNRSSLIPVF
jgi:hypothetical protein